MHSPVWPLAELTAGCGDLVFAGASVAFFALAAAFAWFCKKVR